MRELRIVAITVARDAWICCPLSNVSLKKKILSKS